MTEYKLTPGALRQSRDFRRRDFPIGTILIIVIILFFGWSIYNKWDEIGPDLKRANLKFIPLKADEISIEEIETQIFVLVNQERNNNGAKSLISKGNLDSFARSWSNRMISEGFFEHSDMDFVFSYSAGENIAETPIYSNVVGCGSTYTNSQLAKCFVSGWISSPGHHENMISKSFSMTGIGVSCDASKCRATQVFSG